MLQHGLGSSLVHLFHLRVHLTSVSGRLLEKQSKRHTGAFVFAERVTWVIRTIKSPAAFWVFSTSDSVASGVTHIAMYGDGQEQRNGL